MCSPRPGDFKIPQWVGTSSAGGRPGTPSVGRLTCSRRPARSRVSGSIAKPFAITMPKPVRRPRSAAISAVRTSEGPCGAAITSPLRPGWALIPPRPVARSKTTVWVAQPPRRSGPVPTLRSRASHVVRRLIAYEHRLGERVLPFVTERQEHSAPAPGQPELPRAPGEHEDGRLASLAPHLELAPAHAEPEPRAERLESGLLGREARGKVRHRIAPGAAVRDLRLGEDTLQEPVPPAVDHVAHARDVDEVDADAVDPHAGSLTDLGPDEPRELVRHGAHARAVGPLDHHARQRLRARVANEDSPGTVHLALEGRDALGEPGEGVDRRLRLHGDVTEDLWELGQAPGERGERLARLRGDAEQGERRENAVARGGVVEEQEVP